MRQLLITGFSNFGSIRDNPSEILVNLLKRRYGDTIAVAIFKSYKDIDNSLEALITQTKPKAIVMFGLASKTPFVRLEQIARRPREVSLGEEQFESTLPLRKLYESLADQDIAVSYSNDAGDYWCNYLFYKVCELRQNDKSSVHGLVHIPNLQKYKSSYAKELDLLKLGVTVVDLLSAQPMRFEINKPIAN